MAKRNPQKDSVSVRHSMDHILWVLVLVLTLSANAEEASDGSTIRAESVTENETTNEGTTSALLKTDLGTSTTDNLPVTKDVSNDEHSVANLTDTVTMSSDVHMARPIGSNSDLKELMTASTRPEDSTTVKELLPDSATGKPDTSELMTTVLRELVTSASTPTAYSSTVDSNDRISSSARPISNRDASISYDPVSSVSTIQDVSTTLRSISTADYYNRINNPISNLDVDVNKDTISVVTSASTPRNIQEISSTLGSISSAGYSNRFTSSVRPIDNTDRNINKESVSVVTSASTPRNIQEITSTLGSISSAAYSNRFPSSVRPIDNTDRNINKENVSVVTSAITPLTVGEVSSTLRSISTVDYNNRFSSSVRPITNPDAYSANIDDEPLPIVSSTFRPVATHPVRYVTKPPQVVTAPPRLQISTPRMEIGQQPIQIVKGSLATTKQPTSDVETRKKGQFPKQKKRVKKKDNGMSSLMYIPFMIQAQMLPMMLMNLKFLALKAITLGKLALLILGLNLLRNAMIGYNNADEQYEHESLASQHYGYNGGPEYGSWVNKRSDNTGDIPSVRNRLYKGDMKRNSLAEGAQRNIVSEGGYFNSNGRLSTTTNINNNENDPYRGYQTKS